MAAALRQLNAAVAAVCHCEAVLVARATALLRQGRFKEAEEACGQPASKDAQPPVAAGAGAHWRLWVRAQSAFHQGDYEQALQRLDAMRAELRKAAEAAAAAAAPPFSPTGGSAAARPGPAPTPAGGAASGVDALLTAVAALPSEGQVEGAAARLREAMRLRQAGNNMIQAGRYAEAVKQYTAALDGEQCGQLVCSRGEAAGSMQERGKDLWRGNP